MMTANQIDEFWRLAHLAEHDPKQYQLEMDVRRFISIAHRCTGILDVEWCERALRDYFGLSAQEVSEVMGNIMKDTPFASLYVKANQNPPE